MTWHPRTEPTPVEAERIAYANGDPTAPLLARLADDLDVDALEDEIAYLRGVLAQIELENDIHIAHTLIRDALRYPDV
jgi:hypothetical protein